MFTFAKDEYDASIAFFEASKHLKCSKNPEIIIEMDVSANQAADYFRPGDKFIPTDSNTNGIHDHRYKKIASQIKKYEELGNNIKKPELYKFYREALYCWFCDYKDVARVTSVRLRANFLLSELFSLREMYGADPEITKEIDALIRQFQVIIYKRDDYRYDCVLDGYDKLFDSFFSGEDYTEESFKKAAFSIDNHENSAFLTVLSDHGYNPDDFFKNSFSIAKEKYQKTSPLFLIDGFDDNIALSYTKTNGINTVDIERDTLTAGFAIDNFNTFIGTWLTPELRKQLNAEGRDAADLFFVEGQSLRERYNQEYANDYRDSIREISVRFLSDLIAGLPAHVYLDGKFVPIDVMVNKENLPETYKLFMASLEKQKNNNQFLCYPEDHRENILKASLEKTNNREYRTKNIIAAGVLFNNYGKLSKYMPIPEKNFAVLPISEVGPGLVAKCKKVHDSHKFNAIDLEASENIARVAKLIITSASFYEAHKNTTADKYPLGREMGFRENRDLVYIDGKPAVDYLRTKYDDDVLRADYDRIFDTELVYLLADSKHTIDVLTVGKDRFGKTSAKLVEILSEKNPEKTAEKREERHAEILSAYDIETLAKRADRKEKMAGLLLNENFKKALTGYAYLNIEKDTFEDSAKADLIIKGIDSAHVDTVFPDYNMIASAFATVIKDINNTDPSKLGKNGKEAYKNVFLSLQAAGFFDKHTINPLINELREKDPGSFSYASMFKISRKFSKYVPEAQGLGESKSDIDRTKDRAYFNAERKLAGYAKDMDSVSEFESKSIFHKNSKEFKKMYKAVCELKVYDEIEDFPRHIDDKDNFKKTLKKVKTACNNYIKEKGDGKKPSEEEQFRYDLAKEIVGSIDSFEKEKTGRFELRTSNRERIISEGPVKDLFMTKALTKKMPEISKKKEKEPPEMTLGGPSMERITFKDL